MQINMDELKASYIVRRSNREKLMRESGRTGENVIAEACLVIDMILKEIECSYGIFYSSYDIKT